MKNYLCKCNNCEQVLIDKNHDFNAVQLETPEDAPETVWNYNEQAWVCPNCKVDDYLIDLDDKMVGPAG